MLLDITKLPGFGGPDGLEVDHLGTLFGAGREAVFVFTAKGTHLGTLFTGAITSNLAWGEDGSTLFITTEKRLLGMRLSTKGMGF